MKKYFPFGSTLLAALLACCTFTLCNAQYLDTLKFENLTSMPDGCYGFGYCNNDESIYVVNGATKKGLSRAIEKYDVSSDSWQTISYESIPKRYNNAVLMNDQIVVFNGQAAFGINNKIEIINSTYGTNQRIRNNRSPRFLSGVDLWKGQVLSFGGATDMDKHYARNLYRIDITTNKYQSIAKMPERKQTAGKVVGNALYVVGGYNGKASNTISKYDLENNSWTTIEMELPISAHALAVHDQTIWIVGGYDKMDLIASFNTETEAFTIHHTSGFIARRHAGCAIIGDSLYVFGGNTNTKGSYLSSLQVAKIR